MFRKNGPIPEIKSDRYPHRLVIFDTEAFRGETVDGVELQSFRLGVARFLELTPFLEISKDEFYTFSTTTAFTGYLEMQTRKDNTLFVYAHNIKYDLQLTGALQGLIARGWDVTQFAIDDPPTFIKLKRGRMTILFVDTFNYWQTSVEQMGSQLGLPKLPMPSDAQSDRDMITYCKRDVVVLSDYLLEFMRFLQSQDLAGLGLTLASQAFRAYRHRFMPEDIILHSYPQPTLLERDGYSGGRVECFFIGELTDQPLYKLDVNSMYPFVMRERSYPVELLGYAENISTERLFQLLDRYYVIADVNLSTDAPIYPLKRHHKLIFPIGIYSTVLHQDELLQARSRAHIQSVSRVAIYRQRPIFTDYVDYFYDRKLQATIESNQVERHQAKILLNSLYGKFGQLDVHTKIMPNPTQTTFGRMTGYSQSLGRRVEVNYLGDKLEIRYKSGESAYSYPAIAGAVTAYARVYLWSLIEKAGVENVFYLDTDSLVTNQAGYERVKATLDDTRLGALKLEEVAQSAAFRGAKDYTFGATVKHKGIPKNARQIGPNTYEYEQFRGAKTWVKQGLPVGVEVYTRTKERKSPYDKGLVLPGGKVTPLKIAE